MNQLVEGIHEEHEMHELHAEEHHDAEHDHEAAKDNSWQAAEQAHQALLNLVENQTTTLLTQDNPMFTLFKEHAIGQKETLEVGCIDERCGHQHEGYTVGLGGAGILWDEAKRGDYVNFLVDKAVADGVSKVSIDAHEGCGAAKLYLTSVAGKENPTAEEVNQAAIEFTQQLKNEIAAEIAKRGLSIGVDQGFLASTDMLGSADFHDAIGAAVDTTEKFDSTRRENHEGQDLPPMFNINGTFDAEHTAANVGVALNIAFGDHGFGSRFTKERPFVVTLIVNSNDQVSVDKSALAAEKIKQAAEKRSEFAEGKIVIKVIDAKEVL